MSEERRRTIAKMIENTDQPVAWAGFFEGYLATFLTTKEDCDEFLKNTEPCGKVLALYTRP